MINCIAKDILQIFNVNKFVETGIKEGDTLLVVSTWFSCLYGDKFITEQTKHGECPKGNYNIYEIDCDPSAIDNAKRIKQRNDNIILIQGDSIDSLRTLVNEGAFQPTDSVFFYLDAHLAGVSEPLLGEFDQVRHLGFPFIVCIDDWDVESLRHHGYSDMYGINKIRNSIHDRTDVIYETKIPNVHSKQSCFIFFDYYKKHLSPILRHLPLIETPI